MPESASEDMRGATTFSSNPPVVTQPNDTQIASKENRPSEDKRTRSVTQQETDEMPEEQVPEISDRPVLDTADAAVRKMVNLAKERGYITQELLNPEGVTSEQIEDILAMLNEMGINVVASEESEPWVSIEITSASSAPIASMMSLNSE
jgi:hypothetical protein